jgi:hypothetical protein
MLSALTVCVQVHCSAWLNMLSTVLGTVCSLALVLAGVDNSALMHDNALYYTAL